MRLAIVVAVLAGCVGELPDAGYQQTLPDGPCTIENVTGTLPGVTISIHAESCAVTPGQLATLHFDVTVDDWTPTLVIPADPPGGCGTCVYQTTDPRSWLWPTIGEGEAMYCPGVSYLGCCPPHPELTFELERGTFSRTIEWAARSRDCPSDTNVVDGAYLPPGIHDVRASFHGYVAGSVVAELPIEVLVP